MTHICIRKLGHHWLRQAIIWTNAGILLIGPLGTNFSEILIKIHKFPFKKMHLKTSSAKCWSFCLGLNVLRMAHPWSSSSNDCQSNMPYWTRARLRHVTPLGWPRSIYKSNIECCFLSQNGKLTWRSRSMTPIFNNNWENPKMHIWCKFGDSSSNPFQVIARTNQIY